MWRFLAELHCPGKYRRVHLHIDKQILPATDVAGSLFVVCGKFDGSNGKLLPQKPVGVIPQYHVASTVITIAKFHVIVEMKPVSVR